MIARPASVFCHVPTLRRFPCARAKLTASSTSLGIVELPDACEGDTDVPEGVALHVRVVAVASHLESFPAQGEGRIGVAADDSEKPERARDHAHVAERRCTGRLSSSTRRAVSKSPRTNDMDPIIVCALARVLGEPEPSASSSSRRSRASSS